MKVLHAAHLPFWSGGVARQMKWEQEAADELNLPWHSRIFLAADAAIPVNIDWPDVIVRADHSRHQTLRFRRAYYDWLADVVENYDVIALRYSNYNPMQSWFLQTAKKPVYLIHHTLEVPEIRGLGTRLAPLKALAEEMLGPFNLSRAAGDISVTKEIADYEVGRSQQSKKPSLIYPNGISYSGSGKAALGKASPAPSLLFVASYFYSWHGADLLIDEVARSTRDFKLHLVGNLNEPDRRKAQKDHRIVMHGQRNAEYIQSLASECWAGLSSFALDRKEMSQACTLKVRESLRMGLPVYSGHEDVFPADFPYYRRGACDVDAILEFAAKAAGDRGELISEASRPYIDKSQLVEQIYRQLAG
jgi:glycosyltransferase involved in cell wall biosynthesis